MRTILTLCLFGTALCFSNLAQAAGGYTFIPIPRPAGTMGVASASCVNESGVVAGAVAPGSNVGFIWDQQNGTRKIDAGTNTVVDCINDHGQVVGHFGTSYQWEVFIWQNGTFSNLGKVTGYNQAIPSCINNQGKVVGYASSGVPFKAMTGDASTGLQLLPGVGDQSHTMSYANCINNHNQVVGSWEDNGLETAYVWENTIVTPLASLAIGESSRAQCINDLGVIVGKSGSQAAMWLNASTVIPMGTLLGGTMAEALAVNSQSIAVGYSTVDGIDHAFVWENGIMCDLNTLVSLPSGWVLNYAQAINDSGMIVGSGTYNGQIEAFVLVPEPATMMLLGLGGLALRKRGK